MGSSTSVSAGTRLWRVRDLLVRVTLAFAILSSASYSIADELAFDSDTEFLIANSGASSYIFDWVDNGGSTFVDPIITITAGNAYTFTRTTGGHPFLICDLSLPVSESAPCVYIRDTSDSSVINAATLFGPGDFTWTPTEAEVGEYWYTCAIAGHVGMTGKLVVVSGVQEVTSASFEVTAGNFVSGGIKELAQSDNADLSARRSSTDIQSRVFFEVEGTSPTETPSALSITLEASVFARTNVFQSVDLWDFTASSWEEVDSRNAARFADSTANVDATGDLSRFVEAGTGLMRARIRYQSDGNPRQQFSANVDFWSWTIQ